MKCRMIAGLCAALCLSTAHAQSSVTLYGLIDTTVRYASHANAAGDRSVSLSDGVLTGSRWGMRGTEDLGGGNSAFFILESGFSPDNGSSLQGGRLFGRQAFVGLKSPTWGQVTLGRQYTLAQDVLSSFDAMWFANLGTVGYQFGNYTGGRYDNTLRYRKEFAGFAAEGAYTFGNVAGSINTNSAKAASLTYNHGPLYLGAVYQVTNTVTSGYFGAVSAAQASQQQVWGFGGSYVIGPLKTYLGYTNSQLDVAGYLNRVYYLSFIYTATPALQILNTNQYDMLSHNDHRGHRFTTGLMLDYFLSKRTDTYVSVDYTKLSGEWLNLNSFLGGTYGNNNTLGVSLGLRHRF